ncbi:MAG: FecR family protein [Phycisphaeraceae bacterium]|nr:FecR family protein [Phycisphaeraceae bacterium]
MTASDDQHNAAVAEVADLLPLALEGLADTDQFSRLNALLRDHAAARLYYLQYIELHAELGGPTDILVATETCDVPPDVFREVIDDALKARHRRELESQAQEQLERNLQREHEKQLAAATSVDRGKLQIIIPVWAVIGSAAAAAALIVLAVLPFLKNDTAAPQQQAVQQDTQVQGVPAPPEQDPIVATLTATRDAQWAQTDLAPDDRLIAGQRLTLTAGFAEITTSRGAVAILEAPTTIELIDSPNALRLITGKLIGICETDSSKDFLVRTPQVDVTDLGTRFGIDASNQDSVEVHVFQGEVEVSRSTFTADSPHQPQRLLKGEAARISSDTQRLDRIAADVSLFETTAAREIRLPGTGEGLEAGQPDPNWQIISVDGRPLEPPHILNVDSGNDYNSWPTTDLSKSQWLSWKHDIERPADGRNTYLFQTHFEIPGSMDIERVQVALRYLADNQLAAVHVNGHRLAIDSDIADPSVREVRSFTIEKHLVAGQNKIVFEVMNLWPATYLHKSNPVGLRVEGELKELAPATNGNWRQRIFKP